VTRKVEKDYTSGKGFLLRFKEKGGKEKELPVHHKLEELLDQYLKASGLEKEPGSPLFPASIGKTGKLSRRPLVRTDAADMLKRRLKQAGLPAHLEGKTPSRKLLPVIKITISFFTYSCEKWQEASYAASSPGNIHINSACPLSFAWNTVCSSRGQH
jgi:hypothetical protein